LVLLHSSLIDVRIIKSTSTVEVTYMIRLRSFVSIVFTSADKRCYVCVPTLRQLDRSRVMHFLYLNTVCSTMSTTHDCAPLTVTGTVPLWTRVLHVATSCRTSPSCSRAASTSSTAWSSSAARMTKVTYLLFSFLAFHS